MVAVPAMLKSLRHGNARRFFFGLLVSTVGTWMQMTAMSLVIYDLTGNSTDTGLGLLFQFLPMLLLGSWAGAFADRHNKRRLAIVTQSLQAAQAIILGVLTLTDVITVPLLYVMSLVLGVINAFDNPARRGFVIELVEPDEITNAISINTAVMTGSRVFGPLLTALLKGPLGAGWLFVINGVSFAAIVWSMVAVNQTQLRPAPRAQRGGTPVRDALRFIAADRRLLTVFVVFTVVGTFAFNYSVSLLAISDNRFDETNLFGVLLATTGLGSVAGSLFTGARSRVGTKWFFGNGTLLGVSGFLIAWSPQPWVAVVLCLPVGFGGAAFIAGQNAILQQESPADMRGRLLALGAVAFLGTTPVGAPITGLIADYVSAEWSLAYGSAITLLAVGVGWLLRSRATMSGADIPRAEYVRPALVVDASE